VVVPEREYKRRNAKLVGLASEMVTTGPAAAATTRQYFGMESLSPADFEISSSKLIGVTRIDLSWSHDVTEI